jgi:soluble lytic murein transglycosylase-like protein
VSALAISGVGGPETGATAGEAAAAQRVQQIQTLIEQARETSVPGSGSFASTLQAASATGTSSGSPSAYGAAASAAVYPAAPSVAGESGSGQYDALVNQAAARYGLDPAVLHGLIQQESGFDPNSTSSAGAEGLTQLMPSTAASLGVTNPLDPGQSIDGGARYLSQMMAQFGGNVSNALAAYNAGPGAVQRYGGIPPYAETQSYVAKVLAYAEAYRRSPSASTVAGTVA